MYFLDLAATLRRRWYLAVLSILLCAGITFAMADVVKPTYQATAAVVLLPPKGGINQVVNPYLSLGDTSPVVDVLTGTVKAQTNKHKLKTLAPHAKFTIGQDQNSTAPVVDIVTTSKDRSEAQVLLNRIVADLPVQLRTLQREAGVAPASFITSVAVSKDAHPKTVQKTRVRIVAASAVGSLGLLFAFVGLLDGLLVRRRERRDEERAAGVARPEGPSGDATTADRGPVSPPARAVLEDLPVVAVRQAPTPAEDHHAASSHRERRRRRRRGGKVVPDSGAAPAAGAAAPSEAPGETEGRPPSRPVAPSAARPDRDEEPVTADSRGR